MTNKGITNFIPNSRKFWYAIEKKKIRCKPADKKIMPIVILKKVNVWCCAKWCIVPERAIFIQFWCLSVVRIASAIWNTGSSVTNGFAFFGCRLNISYKYFSLCPFYNWRYLSEFLQKTSGRMDKGDILKQVLTYSLL